MGGHRAVNVLQVVTDPSRRGAQVFALDLGVAFEMAEVKVRTVALGPAGHGLGFDVPVLGERRVSWWTIAALRREMRCVDVTIAHGGQTLPACALANVGTHVPFVYRQISNSLFWAPSATRRLRVRAALSRAAMVVALWEGAGETLQTHFGVRRDRVRVIPNGVAAERFSPVDDDTRVRARRGFSLDDKRFTLVFVGALVHDKGVDVAIEAVGRSEDAQLLVVGDGPELVTLHDLAARVAPGRVTFAGGVADASSGIAAGDAIVLASRGGDSMPAVIIEAALMQLPAVATPVEAIPEVVLPGITGELAPIGDVTTITRHIDGLARDPDRTAALGRNAREHCLERFTIEPIAQAWQHVLDEVVGDGSAAG
jgi:glycosyltransferase involved in cell wall biosynthesis